jgi:hypothetical protein
MAAQNGTLKMGVGQYRKHLSVYSPDAGGSYCTFRADGQKAGSGDPQFYIAPRPGWWLMDLALAAAPSATALAVYVNDAPVHTLTIANHLASVAFRPELGVEMMPGDKLTIATLT